MKNVIFINIDCQCWIMDGYCPAIVHSYNIFMGKPSAAQNVSVAYNQDKYFFMANCSLNRQTHRKLSCDIVFINRRIPRWSLVWHPGPSTYISYYENKMIRERVWIQTLPFIVNVSKNDLICSYLDNKISIQQSQFCKVLFWSSNHVAGIHGKNKVKAANSKRLRLRSISSERQENH